MKAIIDLGTNTFHLLIAAVQDQGIHEHFKLQIPVKIGEGGINAGHISEAAYKRGMAALERFREELDKFRVKDIRAFATSAIRNAVNGPQFIRDAADQYHITIEAISGDAEATYIYEGVRHSFSLPAEPVLVMDIGGGSVEFVIGQQEKIIWKRSFELGAARLIDRFPQHDPITPEERAALNDYFKQELAPLHDALQQFPASILIGSAGSFETLADVVLQDLAVVPAALSRHAFAIRQEDLEVFCELMFTSTIQQRRKLKGMADFRVEMIVVAAALMQYVVSAFAMKQIIASDYSLKEGMLFALSDQPK